MLPFKWNPSDKTVVQWYLLLRILQREIWIFFVLIIISFTFLPVHVHSRVKGWISFLSFFFSLRASPYGWICGVVSTKTPTSIVLCLKNIALSKKFTPLKECNRMVKYQNGKVYKLLTKMRALLNVLCYLTSLLWSWRWAKSSWNVLGKILFAGSRINM